MPPSPNDIDRFERIVLPQLDDAYTLARYLLRDPHEAQDGPRYGGYTSEMFFDTARNESGATAVTVAGRFVWFLDGTVKTYPATAGGEYRMTPSPRMSSVTSSTHTSADTGLGLV